MGQKNSVQDDFYIFPVGSVYYVKFRDPITREIRPKKSTGLRSKTLAKQWAREEWNRKKAIAGKTDIPLYDYASLFYTDGCPHEALKMAKGEHFGYRTKRGYRSDLINYILPDPICQMSICMIKRSDSINFRERIIKRYGYSRRAYLVFQAYKNIIHTALEKGLIDTDPVIRLTIAVKNKEKRPAVSIENLSKLMKPENWDNNHLRLAAITAGMIGLRAGEIRGIKWRDFDPKTNTVHVVRNYIDVEKEKLPKWDKTRSTIYPKILKSLLEPLRADPDERVFSITKRGPLSYRKLWKAFGDAVEKSGIPHVTLHGLRHSIQTALRGRGVNSELLRATFGWTDEQVQEDYTHRELYDLSSQMEITDELFNFLSENDK
jgi:integrase